ncbi:MAG: Gfo/Idh/MocA family oxidoreductase [Candidatus Doudnabacteria bacterium]|nr:Gfo/Idh/MocA family oxidoreductase [Candidatus Doudnabacteria bacterium]
MYSTRNRNKKLNIGIIGCGDIVQRVHLPVLLNIPKVHIRFIYDTDVAKSEKVSRDFKVAAIADEQDIPWNEINCFLIAIPYDARSTVYEKLAKRLHDQQFLFIEKPVILSQQDLRFFQEYNLFRRIFSGFMRRHYSNTNILKQFIENFGVERIKNIRIAEGFKTTATGLKRSGGILAETACHLLDQVNYLLPQFDCAVLAAATVYDDTADVHVDAKLLLKSSGLAIPISATFSRLENLSSGIFLNFGDLQLETGVAPQDTVFISGRDFTHKHQIRPLPAYAVSSYQAFYLEWLSAINHIMSGVPSPNLLSQSFLSGLMIESLQRQTTKEFIS